MNFPPYITAIIDALRQAGFSAYAVGGCVRDSFLSRTPHDWDVTTSATPQETMAVFAVPPFQVFVGNGLKHGTVTVSLDGQFSEVTTFRTEGAYTDHRRPDEVRFVTDICEDLARRDFTVNAMASAPEAGGRFSLVDPFGGREDLAVGILRTVGDAEKRMTEDALRILRGIRFAARYDFTVEEATAAAMHCCAPLLDHIAPERIGEELRGILAAPFCKKYLTQFATVVARILPGADISALPDGKAAPTVRLACLLSPLSPAEAEALLLRYALGGALAQKIALFLRLQMADLTRHDVRCHIADEVGEDGIADYFAYRCALSPADTSLLTYEDTVRSLFAKGVCYNTATLAIGGRDLLAAGIPPSPAVGQILSALTKEVIAGEYKNDRDTLLRAAIEYYSSGSSSAPSD